MPYIDRQPIESFKSTKRSALNADTLMPGAKRSNVSMFKFRVCSHKSGVRVSYISSPLTRPVSRRLSQHAHASQPRARETARRSGLSRTSEVRRRGDKETLRPRSAGRAPRRASRPPGAASALPGAGCAIRSASLQIHTAAQTLELASASALATSSVSSTRTQSERSLQQVCL